MRKKIYSLVMFLFLFSNISFISAGWFIQPCGINGGLWNVHFVNDQTGWICASNGKISKTTNGGSNWTPQNTGMLGSIYTLYFINENTGWAGADSSRILKTTNGGINWAIVQVPSSVYFLDLVFINNNTGFGVGGNKILRTTNGGENWALQTNPSFYSMFGVSFPVDDQIGWTCGNNGTILHTTNGGTNWSQQTTGLTTTFRKFCFIDNNTGWVCGESAGLLKTTNGGVNWQILNPGITQKLQDIQFINQMTGWTVGDGGNILKSTNGGINWSQQGINTFSQYWGIYMVNENIGWCIGGSLLKTTDGGLSGFEKLSNEIPSGFSLTQNYPNPFNPETKLTFNVSKKAIVKITVYDVLGNEIQVLVNDIMQPGLYETEFSGSYLASGIYYCRMTADNFIDVKKMILIK